MKKRLFLGRQPVRRFICSEPKMNITSNENENAGDGEALPTARGYLFFTTGKFTFGGYNL
ncbi:hypothetical protein ACXHJ2_13045 [Paenibacillus sp. ALE3]|uniref:hypothetical protein n=1 Tax=Paenibacillus polymyxa TaxID=1406 RepID=UPI0012DA2EC5|nr:hypothetical protein [Paenibacillus polymyxa]